MSDVKIKKEDRKPENISPPVKQKRKNPHPVRKYFAFESATQQRCRFCGWITRENATRMVKHIAYRCIEAGTKVRMEMDDSLREAKEREQNSSFTEHNKKDIHSLFMPLDDDRKRQCLFCSWTTSRNLTRMRHHIVSVCTKVPEDTRTRFIKTLDNEDCSSSFRIINLDAGDRNKDIHIVSSKEMNMDQIYAVEEASNDNVEYIIYHDAEAESDQQMEANVEEEDQVKPAQSQSHGVDAVMMDEPTVEEFVGFDEDEEEQEGDAEEEELDEEEEDVVEENEQYEGKIEFLDVENRQCQWCRSTFPAQKTDEWAEGNMFCSKQCRMRDDASKKPKQAAEKKNIAESNVHSSIGTRTYGKRKMPLEQTEQDTTAAAEGAKPMSTQVRTRQSVRQNTFTKSIEPPRKEEAKGSGRITAAHKARPASTEMAASKGVQEKLGTARPKMRVNDTQQQESGAAAPEEGSCHSFGGGHVYPQEAPRFVDHKLQYTKAVISRPAPEFEATAVVDGAFKKIKLSDYRGKYLVFFFYPLDFTFVCPTEILAFSDRVNEFKRLNTEVIAASIDSHFTHLAWINTPRKEGGLGNINIPLVSDITHSIAKDYGVYLDDLGHTLRGLFIIDNRGVLRQITMNDLPVGRSVDETLRLVQAFQYTDKHGEVCPAGWKPGQDTIVPNPEAKIKYFEKNH